MSLRARLTVLIVLLLGLGLGAATALAAWQAAQQLRTELGAALLVAAQTVRGDTLARDDPARLARLVAEFNGDRHVQAALLGTDGATLGTSTLASGGDPVPGWFASLVGRGPPAVLVRQAAGTVLLRADPANELLEVWGSLRDELLCFAAFCVPAVLLVHLTLRGALRPLADIADGLGRIEAGGRDVRVPARGPPELAGLARGFNRMSGRLDDVDARNRRLAEQMANLQEEERADLARDLHDEVGPALFAVTMTTATILRLLREAAPDAPPGQEAGIADEVRLIQDSIGHVQRHVRDILGRLRPLRAAEFGLAAAVAELAAFWRARDPSLVVEASVDLDPRPAEAVEETLYRVVQESLSNAVRHARPRLVGIVLAREAGAVTAHVRNDAGVPPGTAMHRTGSGQGRGLAGMRERVAALSGTLAAGPVPGGGWLVAARLPDAASAGPAEPAPDDADQAAAGLLPALAAPPR
ncbi:MAG: histidine kinase [Janthinobacterium lividum]